MINDLIDFLNDSPVNFLAVKTIASMLDKAGYQRIDPEDKLPQLNAGSTPEGARLAGQACCWPSPWCARRAVSGA